MKSSILGAVSTCLVLVSLGSTVHAAEITYGFEVDIIEGPFSPDYQTGAFTFDDSIIPLGGGYADGAELFTSFDFTWDGINYDETIANTGSLQFDANGEILLAVFGSSCTPTGCGVYAGSDDWYFAIGDAAPNEFSYSVTGAIDIWGNPARLTGIVPIPAAIWLFVSGLLGLIGISTRKKSTYDMARLFRTKNHATFRFSFSKPNGV